MNINTDSDIDELLVLTSPDTSSDLISAATLSDPLYKNIYAFISDPSKTTFETTKLLDPYNSSNINTFDLDDNSYIDNYPQSRTVYPVQFSPNSNQSRLSNQEQLKHPLIIQTDKSKSGKIEIISNPRSEFRPRTEKESKDSSHYIRCEDSMPFEYPTIRIPQEWNQQNNIIEITLVDKDKNPHPYILDNKECKTSTLIFKQDQQNSLYFHVTEQDYKKGQKSFLIQHIKPKQDGNITKELIKTRQLEQSMLRFTRFYQMSDGSYHQDPSSIEYSSLMTEDYGDFTIEDVFPLYGPMSGNQKVCVELKGYLPKDLKTDLIINLYHDETSWSHHVTDIKKNRNNFTFLMPSYPFKFMDRAKVNIIIKYKHDIIYQSNYLYIETIDKELVKDNLNESKTTVILKNFSNEVTDVLPVYSSTPMTDGIRSIKRARQ